MKPMTIEQATIRLEMLKDQLRQGKKVPFESMLQAHICLQNAIDNKKQKPMQVHVRPPFKDGQHWMKNPFGQ